MRPLGEEAPSSGVDARLGGWGLGDNPHEAGTEAWRAWDRYWIETDLNVRMSRGELAANTEAARAIASADLRDTPEQAAQRAREAEVSAPIKPRIPGWKWTPLSADQVGIYDVTWGMPLVDDDAPQLATQADVDPGPDHVTAELHLLLDRLIAAAADRLVPDLDAAFTNADFSDADPITLEKVLDLISSVDSARWTPLSFRWSDG